MKKIIQLYFLIVLALFGQTEQQIKQAKELIKRTNNKLIPLRK